MNIAICDDKEEIAKHIEVCLKETMRTEINISVFKSGYALEFFVTEIAKGNVDIIITDIDLCELNGVDVVKSILKEFPHIKIIFISGYTKYIQRVFEIEPVYFLTKPIDEKTLLKAVEKAQKLIEEDVNKSLLIIAKSGIIKLPHRSISYIESSGRIAIVHESYSKSEYYYYKKLDEISVELPSNFTRCHKSYIVNLDKIKTLSNSNFILNDGQKIPISQSKYNRTKEIFISYLGKAV